MATIAGARTDAKVPAASRRRKQGIPPVLSSAGASLATLGIRCFRLGLLLGHAGAIRPDWKRPIGTTKESRSESRKSPEAPATTGGDACRGQQRGRESGRIRALGQRIKSPIFSPSEP